MDSLISRLNSPVFYNGQSLAGAADGHEPREVVVVAGVGSGGKRMSLRVRAFREVVALAAFDLAEGDDATELGGERLVVSEEKRALSVTLASVAWIRCPRQR